MKRREFLRSAMLCAAAGPALRSAFAQTSGDGPVDEGVRRVLVVFKCHLDVGFTDTQANVMRKYFKQYYPQAMVAAAASRERGKNRYVWTTGSWLLYEYLEQANTSERAQMEKAIAAGDIAWHGLPFSWQTELMDRSMVEGCLGFSRSLDARFGKKTIAGKMTDVPGHTRGIVAPLSAGGIRLLDIGVNAASTPPDVPDVFLWKDANGSSLAVIYHRHDYGSVIRIPHSDLAVDVEVRSDNGGPHTAEEIDAIYTKLHARFPHAQIVAASMSEIAAAVEPVRSRLPVITAEIGDTWIYGAPSDPAKLARFREMGRLRQEWIAKKQFVSGDATDRAMLRRLALAAEHTWGTDTKRYIDHEHYAPKDIAQYLNKPNYQVMEHSWQEKRDDIDAGVEALPAVLRQEAKQRLQTLLVRPPDTAGMRAVEAGDSIRITHFELRIDPATGAIRELTERKSRRSWAADGHPLALFTYQTLSQKDYTAFLNAYVRSKEWWAPQDFGKPNLDKTAAESRSWHPALRNLWLAEEADQHRVVAQLAVEDAEAARRGLAAWPGAMFLDLTMPHAEPVVHVRFYALKKTANRMPEAMWLTFAPPAAGTWMLEKVNRPVLATDVVRGGGRGMHAVTEKLSYRSGGHALQISTLDAPVVAFGTRSPLNFTESLPDFSQGAHISLFNNAWGTNYPQWAAGDWLYRFTLRGLSGGLEQEERTTASRRHGG